MDQWVFEGPGTTVDELIEALQSFDSEKRNQFVYVAVLNKVDRDVASIHDATMYPTTAWADFVEWTQDGEQVGWLTIVGRPFGPRDDTDTSSAPR
jgi:hypothetical protein